MKNFATEEDVLKEVPVVQACVKSKTKSTNVYIEALSIPVRLIKEYQNLRYFKIYLFNPTWAGGRPSKPAASNILM